MTIHAIRRKRQAKGHRVSNLVRVTVSLEPELFDHLRDLALGRAVPFAAIIREAIDEYLWSEREKSE